MSSVICGLVVHTGSAVCVVISIVRVRRYVLTFSENVDALNDVVSFCTPLNKFSVSFNFDYLTNIY